MEIDRLHNKCQALVAHIICFWVHGKFHCFGVGLKDVCGKDVKKLFLILQNMGKESNESGHTWSDFPLYVLELQGELSAYSLLLRFVSKKTLSAGITFKESSFKESPRRKKE